MNWLTILQSWLTPNRKYVVCIIKWNLARIEIKRILELKKTIQKMWDEIPEDVVKRSIMSMTSRIQDWEKGRGAIVNV